MNSLEFIDKQIEKIIFKLIEKVEEREKFVGQCAWSTVDFLNAEIKYLENERDTLYEIKSEVEAWYVVKEELQITSKSKNPYGEPLRRYELNVIGQNKIDTLNKALEVKENVD